MEPFPDSYPRLLTHLKVCLKCDKIFWGRVGREDWIIKTNLFVATSAGTTVMFSFTESRTPFTKLACMSCISDPQSDQANTFYFSSASIDVLQKLVPDFYLIWRLENTQMTHCSLCFEFKAIER